MVQAKITSNHLLDELLDLEITPANFPKILSIINARWKDADVLRLYFQTPPIDGLMRGKKMNVTQEYTARWWCDGDFNGAEMLALLEALHTLGFTKIIRWES